MKKLGSSIGIAVLCVHVGVVVFLVGNHFMMKKKLSPPRIAIHTVVEKNPPVVIHSLPKQKLPKKVISKNNDIPKISSPKPHPIEEITEHLPIISSSTQKESPPLFVPKWEQIKTPNFVSEPVNLVCFLQNTLQLPEYGSVVVKIVISPSGTLVSCEILEAVSQKNAEFLKKQLPELCFPCFNTETTYTITFRNVETL